MAVALASGTFGGTGQSASVALYGKFNVSVQGTFVGTVALRRSYDQGSTWNTVESYTVPTDKVGEEPESGILYRLDCTAFTSGTIVYRLSR
ncbi:MAG: hypothetical protein WCF16_10020 [Alphaproteobacteria bacterium]